MDTKQFATDDSGVSPVIGVILMVAITVILAAVIGTFVMDLGQNSASQQASAGVNSAAGNNAVTLTSLSDGTDGIKCSDASDPPDSDDEEWAENVGEKIECDGANAVVAYSTEEGVKNASVYTFD